MVHRGKFIFRFLGFLLFLALLVGAGVMVFNAGQAQGYAYGAASTGQQLQTPQQAPLQAPMPYYGYGRMMHPHFFPFMGFFGFIPLLFGLFIVAGLFRLMFFGHMHMHHGPWANGQYPHHHPWGWGPQPDESEKTPPTPPTPPTTEPK